MATPRSEKKPKAAASTPIRVLPMELQVGDRFMDETAEWEVTGRPFSTAAGKNAHARVRKVSQPEFTDLLSWGAHERISVKRATAEEGKR
jgi:hypothetical protein